MKNILLFLFTILSSTLIAQNLQNGGFENWEVENGKAEPVDWSSIQTGIPTTISNLAPQVIFEEANGLTGTCVKMENKSTFGVVANGILTNGRIFADLDPTKGYVFTNVDDSRWNTPLPAKPDSLVGWFKYQPSGVDKGSVLAILHTGEAKKPDPDSVNYIGSAEYIIQNNTVNNWTRFSVPFTYFNNSTPEYILLILTSGDGTNAVEGSIGYFDDLQLIYSPVSVSKVDLNQKINTFGATQKIVIDSRLMQNNQKLQVKIYDIIGNEVINDTMISGTRKKYSNINSGVYICQIVVNGHGYISKIAVQ